MLFKGGAALRMIYQSPRFSEDLDFSGFIPNCNLYEDLLEEVLLQISYQNVKVNLLESKKTSGGCLSIVEANFFGEKITLQGKISLRKRGLKPRGNVVLISTELYPSYNVVTLDPKDLVEEKIEALLKRQKPRDLFDAYFILRSPTLPHDPIAKHKEKVLRILKKQEKGILGRELKRLLPKTYWGVLRDFPTNLEKELTFRL